MWNPNQYYRYVLKQGMSGWDVWAIQISLNNNSFISPALLEDGTYGAHTADAVSKLQAALSITTDGICGPQTQSTLCAHECHYAQHTYTPNGLLKGMCLGESGGIIPATSALYSDGTRDYGPIQRNMLNPSQSELHDTFNIKSETARVTQILNAQYKIYKGEPGASTDEEAWKLAVLCYNWPAAANAIASGKGNTWQYTSAGISYRLSDPAPWIEAIGVSGVSTGWDWCKFYIDSKITYVTSWSIA